ncbi:Longitudinals lacking protein-like [Armadillidium vulgare]|nr:Longitudinals lacking protein-like [Armadillidium vulgare]
MFCRIVSRCFRASTTFSVPPKTSSPPQLIPPDYSFYNNHQNHTQGQVIRVHKLVLLASSSHFERILEASPAGQQPVIILDGTRYTDLRALVDYMYKGEVNIQQEQLSSLLKTADNLKIKGLADVANKEDDRGGGSRNGSGGGGTNGNLGTVEHSREGSSGMAISPPPMKRPKQSPVDPCSLNREIRDARELRDSREHLPTEPRDLSRDAPRDLSRDISHFGFSNANGNYHLSRRAYSPTHSISTSSNIASARSLLYSSSLITRQSSKSPVTNISSPYFTGSLVRPRSPHNQFDPTPGSSLHPPRTSPQSPVPDHKIVPQISMPPFGLPFTLPMLHESKKILDRSSHKLLPSHYDLPRDDREKDYLPPSWPPRGADLDPPTPKHSSISKLEILEKETIEQDKRNEDEKFSSSSEKDTSFSPPDDTHSISSKTDYTPEGDPDEDEDSNTGITRDAVLPAGNGDVPNLLLTGNNRPPPGTTSTTPATPSKQNNSDMVKCPYCPRSYRHQNNLRTHIRCFHKGVRIPCPICHRGFTRWFTVRCHIAREHQNVDFSRPENLPAQLRRALYPPFTE